MRGLVHLLTVATICASASAAMADDAYTIQIGAFKTPSADYVAPARTVGDVYATERDSGVIALSVGRYDSAAAASAALDQISEHYPSAFVRRADDAARRQFAASSSVASGTVTTGTLTTGTTELASIPKPRATGTATTASTARQSTFNKNDTDLLRSLSDKERQHVVYLDGKLHYKQGNRFIPLSEYQARDQ